MIHFDFSEGQLLLINKPLYWTSFDLVNKVRSIIIKKFALTGLKVGHAGTLDPLATGLMIIATGKATKLLAGIQGEDKEYLATLMFGSTTPSFDLETGIDKEYPYLHITKKTMNSSLQRFLGESLQKPPFYSAKLIKGKRAYKSARKGNIAELEPVKIRINEIEIIDFSLPVVKIRVSCSKGTYIRSLAHDIGIALESGAHLIALNRTRLGNFLLDNAISVKDFENLVLSLA